MRWVDGHKGVFSVELTAVSSVHPQVGSGMGTQEPGPGAGQQFPLTRKAWPWAMAMTSVSWTCLPGKLLTQVGAAMPVAIPAGALALCMVSPLLHFFLFLWSLPPLSLLCLISRPCAYLLSIH